MTSQFCTLPHQLAIASIVLNPTYRPKGWVHAEQAMWACVGLSAILFVLSAVPVTLRFLIRDKHHFFRSMNGYWCPNAPLLGSLMVAVYSVLSAAATLLSRSHLLNYANNKTTQMAIHLSLLIPTPHFIWAWLYCMSASSSFHAMARNSSPITSSKEARRMSPFAHNFFFAAVPVLAIAISVIAFPIAASLTFADATDSIRTDVELHGYRGAPQFYQATLHKCQVSDAIYRALWVVWGLWYSLALWIYLRYTRLFQQELQKELDLLDTESIDSRSQAGSQIERPAAVILEKQRVKKAKRVMEITTLRIVRRNLQLGKLEMMAFAMYCCPWPIIGIYKALRGFDVFTGLRAWVTLLGLEVLLSVICNAATLGVVTWRSYHIYSAQRRYARGKSQHASLQVTVVTEKIETVSSDEDKFLAFEGDANGAYSDYPDIAQLVFTRPTPVRLPSSRSIGDKVDDKGAWSAPQGWDAVVPGVGGDSGGGGEDGGRKLKFKDES